MSATQAVAELEMTSEQPPAMSITDEDGTAIPVEEADDMPESEHTPASDMHAIRAVAPFNIATTRKIIRQVEYYFSDQNLPTDSHLLGLAGGDGNGPVSFNQVTGWKKMRGFKPRSSVRDALSQSTVLELLDEGKKIKRRFPLMAKIQVAPQVDIKAEYIEKTLAANPHLTKNMLKPTGFEKFYADSPVSPQQHEKILKLYDPELCFETRIENAIRHYRSRRKMHQHTLRIFERWMIFGGIDTSPGAFNGGIDEDEYDDLDKYDIAARKFSYYVDDFFLYDEGNHYINFELVALAFLSTEFPELYDTSPANVRNACNVMVNFLNFLLHHDVCPEYAGQILAARQAVKVAEPELCKIPAANASLQLTGGFSTACAVLHDERYSPHESTGSKWITHHDGKLSTTDATMILKTGLAAFATMEQLDEIQERYAKFKETAAAILAATAVETDAKVNTTNRATSEQADEDTTERAGSTQVDAADQASDHTRSDTTERVGNNAQPNTTKEADADQSVPSEQAHTAHPSTTGTADTKLTITNLTQSGSTGFEEPINTEALKNDRNDHADNHNLPEPVAMSESPFSVVASEFVGLEITALEKATGQSASVFNMVAGTIVPMMGIMRCRTWTNPDAIDVPADRPRLPDTFQFIVEEPVLQSCEVGMKLDAYVHQLDIGICWLDQVIRVYPTFYTTIPDYKAIKRRRLEAELAKERLAKKAGEDAAADGLIGHNTEPVSSQPLADEDDK